MIVCELAGLRGTPESNALVQEYFAKYSPWVAGLRWCSIVERNPNYYHYYIQGGGILYTPVGRLLFKKSNIRRYHYRKLKKVKMDYESEHYKYWVWLRPELFRYPKFKDSIILELTLATRQLLTKLSMDKNMLKSSANKFVKLYSNLEVHMLTGEELSAWQ